MYAYGVRSSQTQDLVSESRMPTAHRHAVYVGSSGSAADRLAGAASHAGSSSQDNYAVSVSVSNAALLTAGISEDVAQDWLSRDVAEMCGVACGLLRVLASGDAGDIMGDSTDIVLVLDCDSTRKVLCKEEPPNSGETNPLANLMAQVLRLLVEKCRNRFNIYVHRTNGHNHMAPAGALLHTADALAAYACPPHPQPRDLLQRNIPCTSINMTFVSVQPLVSLAVPDDINWAQPTSLPFTLDQPLQPLFRPLPDPDGPVYVPREWAPPSVFDVEAAVKAVIAQQKATAAAEAAAKAATAGVAAYVAVAATPDKVEGAAAAAATTVADQQRLERKDSMDAGNEEGP